MPSHTSPRAGAYRPALEAGRLPGSMVSTTTGGTASATPATPSASVLRQPTFKHDSRRNRVVNRYGKSIYPHPVTLKFSDAGLEEEFMSAHMARTVGSARAVLLLLLVISLLFLGNHALVFADNGKLLLVSLAMRAAQALSVALPLLALLVFGGEARRAGIPPAWLQRALCASISAYAVLAVLSCQAMVETVAGEGRDATLRAVEADGGLALTLAAVLFATEMFVRLQLLYSLAVNAAAMTSFLVATLVSRHEDRADVLVSVLAMLLVLSAVVGAGAYRLERLSRLEFLSLRVAHSENRQLKQQLTQGVSKSGSGGGEIDLSTEMERILQRLKALVEGGEVAGEEGVSTIQDTMKALLSFNTQRSLWNPDLAAQPAAVVDKRRQRWIEDNLGIKMAAAGSARGQQQQQLLQQQHRMIRSQSLARPLATMPARPALLNTQAPHPARRTSKVAPALGGNGGGDNAGGDSNNAGGDSDNAGGGAAEAATSAAPAGALHQGLAISSAAPTPVTVLHAVPTPSDPARHTARHEEEEEEEGRARAAAEGSARPQVQFALRPSSFGLGAALEEDVEATARVDPGVPAHLLPDRSARTRGYLLRSATDCLEDEADDMHAIIPAENADGAADNAAGEGATDGAMDGAATATASLESGRLARASLTPGSPALDLDERLLAGVTQRLNDWNLDTLDLEYRTSGHSLLYLSWALFKTHRLLSLFDISDRAFYNYVTAVEHGYLSNPYHNSAHAADVLNSTQVILQATQMPAGFSRHDMFALFVSAIIHDFQHPGVSNAFLIKSNAKLAITYSDSSVLERHHVAAAFMLTRKRPSCNIFRNMSDDMYRSVRSTIIENVLATDLKRHFEILGPLKAAIASGTPPELKLMMQIMVKAADLGHAAKDKALHLKWTDRIVEEFFRQGEEERRRGLPISPFMDRRNADTPKNQIGFFDFLVLPLYQAMAQVVKATAPMLRQAEVNYDHWRRESEPGSAQQQAVVPAPAATALANAGTAADAPDGGRS